MTLASAEGDVPTPHGMIHVAWAQTERNLVLHVDAPTGTEADPKGWPAG